MGEIKEEFQKRSLRYKIALVITLVGLLSLIGGGSYAILKGSVSSSNEQVIEIGKIKLLLTEDYENISSKASIMSDVDGLLLDDSYEFSIKNIGDSPAKIDVSLLNRAPQTYDGDVLDNEYIKVGLEVNGKEQGPMNLEEVNEIIDSNIINQDEIINYKLRVWLNLSKKSELESLTNSKMFLKLSVDAEQRVKEKIEPINFATDSWNTIVAAVQSDNTSVYHVGDTKCVALNGYTTTNDNGCENGEFALRIANKSKPTECSTQGFSQTACGFVLEFADIITTHNMKSTDTNVDGWPASSMRSFISIDIFNALPSDLKNSIIDTTVVSGHGSTSGEVNFTSTDKIYLLSAHEVWEDGTSKKVSSYDTAWDNTRQLDYYNELGVTTNNYSGAIKKSNNRTYYWWLRSAISNDYGSFLGVPGNGDWNSDYATDGNGVSPAFRLG